MNAVLLQDNGKKSDQEEKEGSVEAEEREKRKEGSAEAEDRERRKEGSAEAEDREKKIISSEEEAKARIAEKRREMKVCHSL